MKIDKVKIVSGISGFEKPGNDFVALEIEGTFKYHKQAVPLVLAAPELLEALERAQKALNWYINDIGECDNGALSEIESAISKAKGE